jgi:uncharacterized protein (UPF0254 family)
MNATKILSVGVLIGMATLFTACAPANIQAQIRNSDVNSNMMTRCEEVDMRSNSDMEKMFKKYDGWRMVYISEYTTGNKIGTSGSVCFEKPNN